MPCSYCKNATHNIRNCLDPSIADLSADIVEKSASLDHVDFYNYAKKKYTANKLKAILASYGIVYSRRRKIQLVSSLTIHHYFPTSPSSYAEPREYLFYRFLVSIREGMPYEIAYENFRSNGLSILYEIQRQRRIHYLQEVGQILQPNTREFAIAINAIRRGPISIESFFGANITMEDVFEHIPAISQFFLGDDVIRSQKLDIKIEIDATFSSKDECEICYDKIKNVYLNCKHAFCGDCVSSCLEVVKNDSRKTTSCPLCRESIEKIHCNNAEISEKIICELEK
jgi:hypothetical protein